MLGLALYAAGEYEEAVVALHNPATYGTGSRRVLAASLAQLERLDEANREARLYMAANPLFTISYWKATQPFRDTAVLDHLVSGFRKAGLAE
jgi:hypothetical protein